MNKCIRTSVAVLCGLIGVAGTSSAAESALDFSHSFSRVGMSTNLFYSGLTNLTLSAWVKTSVKPASGSYGSIAGWGYLSGALSGFGLFVSGDGKAYFQTRNFGTTIPDPAAAYPFDGKWHHLTGVREGNTSRLYLDGVLKAEAAGALTNFYSQGIAFGLGARHGGGATWDHPFSGTLAEVRLWDHARTQAQIQEGMFRCLAGTEPGLAGYWPLDEGAGTAVTDRTAARNNGVIANGATWLTDLTVAALLPVSRDLSRQGYWPFTLADLKTGLTRSTDSTRVAVGGLTVPAGCDFYQISTSASASSINPDAWVSTGTLTNQSECSAVAEGKPAVLFAWFTNTVGNVPLCRSGASITYATTGTGVALDFNHASARAEMAKDLYPGLTNLTLSVWVKASAPPVGDVNTGYGAIAGRGYLGNLTGFGLYVTYDGKVTFQTRNLNIANLGASATYPFDGKWHHVAGVRDGNVTRLYLDGGLAAQITGAIATLYGTGIAFGIGARHTGGTAWGLPFTGTLAEVRLWNCARTQDQIREEMFRCLSGTETGLIGYWPLNGGAGTVVPDLTVAGNSGTRSYAYWTSDVAFGPMLSATGAYLGYWPFTLADLETGDTRVTDSNVVAVAGFPVPADCNAYQISTSSVASAVDPGAWVSTNTPPAALSLSTNAWRASVYAWFTNTAVSVPLRRSTASIIRFPVEAALDFSEKAYNRVMMATDLYPGLVNLTLSAWVKTSVKPAPGGLASIAGRGYLGGSFNGFGLLLAGDGRAYFQTRNGNTTILEASTAYPFDGKWHHLTGVRDGNATRLYLDGVLVSEAVGVHTSLYTDWVAFGLGARHDGVNCGYFFEGAMAEVRLWNRARTQAQIQDEMFRCLTGTEPGLVGYWPLSEGAGMAVTDRTPFGNDGVRENSPTWLADMTVTALLPASRDPSRLGYWPFTLADLETGGTLFTGSNVVAVAGFPSLSGYNVCQISASPATSAVDPGAWISTNPQPARLALAETEQGQPAVLFAWFTNTVGSAALRRSGASIIYAPLGGPALKFNNNASARAEMAKDLYPGLTNLTLSAWVKTSVRPATNSYGAIAGQGYLGGAFSGFGLFVSFTGQVSFQTRDHDFAIIAASVPYAFDGTWHHLAGVREGNVTRLYVDGEFAAQTNGVLANCYTPGIAFGLGARHDGVGWGFPFNGAMADVRLWDHARSREEIRSDMRYRLTGAEAGLLGYWPLNEGEGRVIADLTPPSGKVVRLNAGAWEFTADFMRERPPPGTLILLR